MPAQKFEPIYRTIKAEIESGQYKPGDFLPSENYYASRFACSRNTVRRALSVLTSEGYLLPQHGRGVQVIYQNRINRSIYSVGGIESLAEAASRNDIKIRTKIIRFKKIICDPETSLKTGFDTGTELFHIIRLRILGKDPIILDKNWFLASEMPELTKKIASDSIYKYLEEGLGMTITNSRRKVTSEASDEMDEQYLKLSNKHIVLCVSGQVFNSRGVMFEYTQSRHDPDRVCFIESAVRQKI
jgi:GntR family trehalose operon transcriptional repressor